MNEKILRDLDRLAKIEKEMGSLTFPPFIDSSSRSHLAECGQKYNLSSVQKLTPKDKSVHLHFGAAFADALCATRNAYFGGGASSSEARFLGFSSLLESWGTYEPMFSAPGLNAKTLDTCVAAFDYYLDAYPLEVDSAKPVIENGKPCVEFTFAMPIPEVPHPETGEPMLYVGRFDMLAEVEGILFVHDDKTAGQLGATWNRKWELRSQFSGYCAAARHYDYPVVGALVRGIAIYKTKFEHAQAITYRDQWLIDRWYHQLVRDLQRAITSWKTGVWDYNLDDVCSQYGGCPFLQLCNKANPQQWVEGNYVLNPWNPLEKDS